MNLDDFDLHVDHGLARAAGIDPRELDFDTFSTHENHCHMALDRRTRTLVLLGLDASATTMFGFSTWELAPDTHIIVALPRPLLSDSYIERWTKACSGYRFTLLGYRRHNPPMMHRMRKGPFEEYAWLVEAESPAS